MCDSVRGPGREMNLMAARTRKGRGRRGASRRGLGKGQRAGGGSGGAGVFRERWPLVVMSCGGAPGPYGGERSCPGGGGLCMRNDSGSMGSGGTLQLPSSLCLCTQGTSSSFLRWRRGAVCGSLSFLCSQGGRRGVNGSAPP